MKTSLLKYFRRDSLTVKLTSNKKLLLFIACLLVSFSFWLLIVLAKTYTDTISLPIVYLNKPEDKILTNTPPTSINMVIQSTGWELLSYIFNFNIQPVKINLWSGKKHFTKISTKSTLQELNSQLSENVKIIIIQPDTLYFNFENKFSKSVPVKVNTELTFKNQFGLSGNIILSQNNVILEGPASKLEKISYWETELIKLNSLADSAKVTAKLLASIDVQISVNLNEIKVTIPVEQFTESSLIIPITIINSSGNNNLKIFPNKTEIKFKLALSKYDKISKEMFQAVIKFDNTSLVVEKIPIEILKTPDWVKDVEMHPSKVDYIIQKSLN